jgi:Protein of unknown function (DUF3179)
MNATAQIWQAFLVGAMLCAPPVFAWQQPPTVKVETKAVNLPAGRGQTPFNVTRHLIPLGDIQAGGPPKDGIPALDHPSFISATDGDQVLKPSDVILGLEFDGVAKAYPIRILNWHEVVNDDVGHQPVLVSWCPLCGSGLVYDPVSHGQRHTFGVSGLLYKRNLLLYDHETESLWSQLGGVGVTGDLAGTSLNLLQTTETVWANWKLKHPQTAVLSFNTGYKRDYARDPYSEWQIDRRLALVVRIDDITRLYPFAALKKAGTPLVDAIEGRKINITFDSRDQTASVQGTDGEVVPHFVAFLADARAFYPDAPVFERR